MGDKTVKKQNYRNLNHLLHCDRDAECYFTVLPDPVRERVIQCGDSIRNLAALREYSENVLRELY